MTSERDRIALSVYRCVSRLLKKKKVFLYISYIIGGESELKLEIINYVEDRVEPIIQLFNLVSKDNHMFKTTGKSYAFVKILYSLTVAKLEAMSEETLLNTDIDMFKELFESCYVFISGTSADKIFKKTAKCNYEKLDEIFNSVIKTASDLCIHRYVIDRIEKSYGVIQSFLSDYEYSLKLKGRPRTKYNKANAYFMDRYNINYSQAADIYNSYDDLIMLYDVLSNILEVKNAEIEELKNKFTKEERIVMHRFGNEYVQYCSDKWIEYKIKDRLKVLKKLRELYPGRYNDEYIKNEIKGYRKYLERKCKKYRKQNK